MESLEAIKQVGMEAAPPRQGAWARYARDHINAAAALVRRCPLFHKVIIANTVLISIGAFSSIYLEKTYLAGREWGLLALFLAGGVSLSILVNYVVVKRAFRPLVEITGIMRSIRAGDRSIRAPEISNDAQISELSRSLNSMLELLESQRKKSASSMINAQEDERKRIARELHDETSQSITGLAIGIRMVEEAVPVTLPEVREGLRRIKELAHNTLGEVHKMAVRLRPSVLDDLGLPSALRSHVKEFSENTGIDVDLRIISHPGRLSPELETVLYRVVQEALTNIARHSGAKKCKVILEHRDARLHGVISDDGRGFEPREVMAGEKGCGLGLHGMQERIELVDGSIEFDSCPDGGTTIKLEVPAELKEGIW